MMPAARAASTRAGARGTTQLHLAVSTSFLYGENFPPVYTPMPPAALLYPFLPDFQTALLVALGASFHAALVSTGFALSVAVTGIFYTFALRLLRAWSDDKRPAPLDARTGEAATEEERLSSFTKKRR